MSKAEPKPAFPQISPPQLDKEKLPEFKPVINEDSAEGQTSPGKLTRTRIFSILLNFGLNLPQGLKTTYIWRRF